MPHGARQRSTSIPLSAFHQQVSAEAPLADENLPSGPVGTAGSAPVAGGTRRWVAEWGGGEEVLEQTLQGAGTAGEQPASLDSYKAAFDLCLREFFSNNDLTEATRCVEELGSPNFRSHVIKRGVTLAMDKAGREREMTAVLLALLHARGVLTSADVRDGFLALLESVDDLMLDIPAARGLLAHFFADAHLDGILPRTAIDEIATKCGSKPTAAKVLEDVTTRLLGRVPLGGSQLDRASLRSRLRRVVEEYISSHDVREVERRLQEIHVPADLTHELARAAIELGLERRDHERELVSQLLSALHGSAHLRAEAVVRGFEQLLSRVDDLAIDNPQASAHLASFMTRAVADEILPAAFVATPPPGTLATALQIQTLNQARAPLVAAHFGGRRLHVWGVAADASLEGLKKAVIALCEEYIVSGEVDEAVRCVQELAAPSYHHEVVRRLVSKCVVDGGPRELHLAIDLTSKLFATLLLTSEQLAQGCSRLVDALPDLQLDHPHAPELLADYLERCVDLQLLAPAGEWKQSAAQLRAGKASPVADLT